MKFKGCGVYMLDSADDILPAALHFLRLDPNSTDPADLEKAADLVARVRPAERCGSGIPQRVTALSTTFASTPSVCSPSSAAAA